MVEMCRHIPSAFYKTYAGYEASFNSGVCSDDLSYARVVFIPIARTKNLPSINYKRAKFKLTTEARCVTTPPVPLQPPQSCLRVCKLLSWYEEMLLEEENGTFVWGQPPGHQGNSRPDSEGEDSETIIYSPARSTMQNILHARKLRRKSGKTGEADRSSNKAIPPTGNSGSEAVRSSKPARKECKSSPEWITSRTLSKIQRDRLMVAYFTSKYEKQLQSLQGNQFIPSLIPGKSYFVPYTYSPRRGFLFQIKGQVYSLSEYQHLVECGVINPCRSGRFKQCVLPPDDPEFKSLTRTFKISSPY